MNLEEQIYLQNPWYRNRVFRPKELNLPKRAIFDSLILDILSLKQIISLTGLRRVGKSTLLKQIIGTFLEKGEGSSNILYFSFEEPAVNEERETLEKLILFYLNQILGKDIYKISEKVYIFLDEIQLVPFWQDVLKRFYDINQNLKFIVSGSASLFLIERSKESLAGRILERYLPPLSWSEYRKFSQSNDFVDFLDFGQFPELLEIKDNERKTEYLKEGVVGKVLEVDIPKIYHLRKNFDFERLFWSLLPNTGQVIATSKLSADLNLKKATLANYLKILQRSLLMNKVLNLSGSFRSEARLLRKFYPASANFLSLIPESVNIGLKAETYICSLLRQKTNSLYLFHQRGKEIDFILPDKRTAIEVKYQQTIRPSDYWFLEKFIQKKNYQGLVVTKNYSGKLAGKNLTFLTVEEFESAKM